MSLANAVITADQIASIVQDVWESFLQLSLVQIDDLPETGPTMTGCVQLTGEWQGSVFVRCNPEHVQFAAEAMFAAEPGSLGPEEISDALGELTNMVGGNVKSLLPAPTGLSLPSVAEGESYTLRVPGAALVESVALLGDRGTVHVSLWRS